MQQRTRLARQRSYRLARRSFLAAVGGAFGLKTLLDNLEATAQETPPPPRFLMTHWPVGTIRYHFLPTGEGTTYTTSRILQPFEDAGLREEMIVLYGLRTTGSSGQGGGHEAGTPMVTTGADCPGTRSNGGEEDDAAAGGPSFDQIFLENVPDLKKGAEYVNAICDARIDSNETSTRCLSYSYTKRDIQSARPGGTISEAVPLVPELSPTQLYASLFGDFMPGGGTEENQEALLIALQNRKSVLDFALDELGTLQSIAPASESSKLDAHAEAIRKVETQLSDQINSGMITPQGCQAPTMPDASLVGGEGSRYDYGDRSVNTADDVLHEQVGIAHSSIIRAAFQCDLLRVATFQWSPGTNHVSFAGQLPDEPNAIYMHHPLSHEITNGADVNDSQPGGRAGQVVEFLTNVQTWYNQKTADVIAGFKEAEDVYGGNLLDYTIIPYVTEVAETTHSRNNMPGMIFGGRALGMQGGQFVNLSSGGGGFGGGRPWNDFWMTIAQAYFKSTDPASFLSGEAFIPNGDTPIDGLWMPV